MSDEGPDPCECLLKHELAMQRLLSILRQSQDYCTDNECLNILPGPRDTSFGTNLLMPILIIAFFVLMFALRPKSLRSASNNNVKRQDNGPDSNGDPPTPPPAVN